MGCEKKFYRLVRHYMAVMMSRTIVERVIWLGPAVMLSDEFYTPGILLGFVNASKDSINKRWSASNTDRTDQKI